MGWRSRSILRRMRRGFFLGCLYTALLLPPFSPSFFFSSADTSVSSATQLASEAASKPPSPPLLRGGGGGLDSHEQIKKEEEGVESGVKKKKKKFGVPKWHSPKWVAKLVSKVTGEGNEECLKIKKKGLMPEARFHSPLKHYGYVSFDEETKTLNASSGLPLSLVNGFPVPIRVGQSDYTVQGGLSSVLLFLECFAGYEVIGSYLSEDGHWLNTQQADNPVYVQLENTGPSAFGSARRVLLQYSAERLIKSVAPLESFNGIVEKAVSSIPVLAPEARHALQAVAANWIYLKGVYQLANIVHLDSKEVQEAWHEMSGKKSFKERAKVFVRLLKRSREQEAKERWSGREFLDPQKPVTLTLTMYPKPAHGVRATLKLPSNRVFLQDILHAVAAFAAGHDGISEALSELIFD
ncbi:hypothetical protein Emed_007351 [Eimeria media]